MEDLAKVKQLKPWLTNSKDLDLEMKELGLKKRDLKLDGKNTPIVLDVMNSHVDRVSNIDKCPIAEYGAEL